MRILEIRAWSLWCKGCEAQVQGVRSSNLSFFSQTLISHSLFLSQNPNFLFSNLKVIVILLRYISLPNDGCALWSILVNLCLTFFDNAKHIKFDADTKGNFVNLAPLCTSNSIKHALLQKNKKVISTSQLLWLLKLDTYHRWRKHKEYCVWKYIFIRSQS